MLEQTERSDVMEPSQSNNEDLIISQMEVGNVRKNFGFDQ